MESFRSWVGKIGVGKTTSIVVFFKCNISDYFESKYYKNWVFSMVMVIKVDSVILKYAISVFHINLLYFDRFLASESLILSHIHNV